MRKKWVLGCLVGTKIGVQLSPTDSPRKTVTLRGQAYTPLGRCPHMSPNLKVPAQGYGEEDGAVPD